MVQNIQGVWTSAEQQVAQEIFNRAYEREIEALIKHVQDKARHVEKVDELWKLHDFLSAKRHEIDGKYEYEYSSLIFVLAELVRDGWLTMDELKDLDKDKRAKIAALTRL
jgi:hypothetical protein